MPRKVFVAGEILTAADVNTNLMDQSVMVFDDATARTTAIPTPSEGMVTYLKDEDEVTVFDGSAFTAVGPGKILQVVRATDTTNRSTSSTAFTDANISATITPISATSTLQVSWFFRALVERVAETHNLAFYQITDSSNTALSGAEALVIEKFSFSQSSTSLASLGVVAAGSTSAQTFKGRFRIATNANAGLAKIENASQTGQIIITEVAG